MQHWKVQSTAERNEINKWNDTHCSCAERFKNINMPILSKLFFKQRSVNFSVCPDGNYFGLCILASLSQFNSASVARK